MEHLFDIEGDLDGVGGDPEDHLESEWPTTCESCGSQVPPMPEKELCPCGCGVMRLPEHAPIRHVFRRTLFATPDRSWIGLPGVGDCYYADWFGCDKDGYCHHKWTNCTGRHLIVHTPDPFTPEGHRWDTNGRASNCTMKDDGLHRCWVVHGRPELGEKVTVDKVGVTCGAGGGSIDTGRWHGMLTNGVLEKR
jgi:hypothetical protein